MRKKEITLAERLQRVKELGGITSINENKKGTLSTVEYIKKVGDVTFGVIKESGSYYIKSTNSDIINESTFDYIGGLPNKNEYKYNSYADALKNLNMIDITITESLLLHERFQKDIQNDGAPGGPMPEPISQQPSVAPTQAPMAQPNPEEVPPAPIDNATPPTEDNGELDNDSDLDDDDDSDEIDHYVGKLTQALRDAKEGDLTEEKIKGIMNSMISALPLDQLSPEDRLELAKRVKRGGKKKGEEDQISQEQPSPEPESQPESAPENEPIQEEEMNNIEGFIQTLKVKIKGAKDRVSNTKDPNIIQFFKGCALGLQNAIDGANTYFQTAGLYGNEPIQENNYSWNKCEKDQEKEYGSKKTADKVCGAIKAGHIKEDKKELVKPFDILKEEFNKVDDQKMSDFISKIDKKDLIFENSQVKYKNVLLESKDNILTLDNGKSKFDFTVSKDTAKKFNYLINEFKIKIITESENKVKQIIKEVIKKTK